MNREECRVCLLTVENVTSLFSLIKEFDMTVKDIIMNCSSVKIIEEDNLTKFICGKCTSDAILAYGFKKKCENSEEILHSRKCSTFIKTEYDDDIDMHDFNVNNVNSERLSIKSEHGDSPNSPSALSALNSSDLEDDTPLNKIAITVNPTNRPDKRSKMYECITCNLAFKNRLVLKRHFIKMHSLTALDKKLKNKCVVKKEKKHNDEKNIMLCDKCDHKCSTLSLLKKHRKTHSPEKPFACDKCTYRTRTAYSLRTHAATHTTDKPFSCDKCSFTCKLLPSLVQHIARTHEQRKDYPCNTCGKRFFSTSHRKIHMRVHTGERPYSCDKCGLSFSQKSNLEKHIKIIHDGASKTFSCSTCNYTAHSIYTMKCHEKKHTGERPLKCDMCNYSCIATSTLKLHRQRHAGDANYKCDICDYKCYTPCRLKDHKRTHTGERPYSCNLCEYRSKTDTALRNHKISHSNEQKYSCSNCLYRTNYKSNLTKHELKLCGRMTKNHITKNWFVDDILIKEQQIDSLNKDASM